MGPAVMRPAQAWPDLRPALARRLAVAAVALPLLAACGAGSEPGAAAAVTGPAATASAVPAPELAPAVPVPAVPAPVPAAPGEEVVVTEVVDAGAEVALPPGDPGVDAPAVPEPVETEVHAHDEELPDRVPQAALLRAADLGPGWQPAERPPAPCGPRVSGPSATAALAGTDSPRSTLVQTVAVAQDAPGAVADWRHALAACGYAVAPLALGEDGLAASSAGERVLVTTAEQVVVVLRATGPLATDPALDDWADLALGTSCPAAPDGCH